MGAAAVSLTDAPGDYDNVFITVKNIWFHASDSAGPNEAGWHKYPLAAPVTVDLLTLSNGAVGSPIWGNISLPVGSYQQIRLVLAGTEDQLAASASTLGLQYNNEVKIGSQVYPLRIPDAIHGIRLPGTFQITQGGTLRLAIDFDAGHDVVEIQRNGNTEYILKTRLAYFDLDDAGAITGSIDTVSAATNSTSHFVIKAEQVDDPANPQYHVVRRWTTVNAGTGRFILYPLQPGTYDIVIRGIGYQTVIVKGVPVVQGTTPLSGATIVPLITMTTGADYTVDGAITSPTGAWAQFYQTLQGAGEVPYEIRFRHFNPMTGKFIGFKLSSDQLQVASYVSNTVLSGPTSTTPVESAGVFSATANAMLYDRSATQLVTSSTGTVSFPSLSPKSPPSVAGGNSISGTISTNSMGMGMMNRGILFAVHDGMVINAMNVDSQMGSGGAYSMTNLPGGTPSNPLPGAFYGIEALGWSTLGPAKAVSVPGVADLRTGNASAVDMSMIPF